LAVSQIRGVAPRLKIHYSDPSLDRSTRNVRQLEHNFKPYRIMFKELKGKKQFISQCFCKEMETPKILKLLFFEGGRNYSRFLAFSEESCNLTLAKSEV
jgi:hypothetical protein